MKTILLPILVAGSFTLPAFAQASKPVTAAPVKVNPIAIELKTSDVMMAGGMLQSFESEAELPELGEGQHYVITLTKDAECKVKTAEGKVGWMSAKVHPRALMAAYKDEIDMQIEGMKNQAVGAMAMFGISAKQAGEIMDGMIDFPNQIKELRVNLPKNMMMEGFKNASANMAVEGFPGTWFGNVIAATKPGSTGAPVLPSKDPVMSMRGAVNTDGLSKLMEPIYTILGSLGTTTKTEREKNMALLMKLAKATDGSFAVAGNPFASQMSSISGLSDAATAKSVMDSEDWAKLTENQASIIPMADVEMEANALTHREVKVSKMSIEMDNPVSPNQTTYTGVAGNYSLSYGGESEDGIKGLIDMVLDQKIKRAPVAGGALATMMMNVEKMMDSLADMVPGAEFDAERFPKFVHMQFHRKGPALTMTVQLK